jgi:hypothetical protein
MKKESQAAHREVRRRRKGIRRKGIMWEYNWDGCFSEERYNADEKRYWRRWKRRQGKEQCENPE